MPLFTFVGKAKDWQNQFRKVFGGYPKDATLEDVVKPRMVLANNVIQFINERDYANKQHTEPQNKSTILQSSTQDNKEEGTVVQIREFKKKTSSKIV